MCTAACTDVTTRQPGGRLRRAWEQVDWFASFWLVFLLAPLIAVLQPGVPQPAGTITVLSLLAFAAAYVWSTSTMPGWADYPEGTSGLRMLRALASRLALLAALAAPSVWLLGWLSAFYLPYVCAVILFGTTLRVGVPLVVALCTVAVSTVSVSGAGTSSIGTVLGCSCSSLAILIGRLEEERSVREHRRREAAQRGAERERISRDVHDLLGHSLTVLTLKAEVAQRLVRADPERAEAELAEIVDLARQALADVRATVTLLQAPDLAGQVAASRSAFAAAGVGVTIEESVASVPLSQRELLAWALREGTTNVLRHAGATHVEIRLLPGLVWIADDGAGLGGRAPGNGLAGLRHRLEEAGGTLTVTDREHGGTLLEARLPTLDGNEAR